MIRYTGDAITFAEVPDEVSLCISISNCLGKCKGCHSPELQKNVGRNLENDIDYLLTKHEDDATCVCLLGEGNDVDALVRVIARCKLFGFKVCLYSGRDVGPEEFADLYYLDYLKTGSYKQDLGALDSETTNQHMYKMNHGKVVEDITYKFRKKEI